MLRRGSLLREKALEGAESKPGEKKENKNVKDFTHEKKIANQTIEIFTLFDFSIKVFNI